MNGFFDVFPELKLKGRALKAFSRADVKKVATNAGRDYLHVYIESRSLIEKADVYEAEAALKEYISRGAHNIRPVEVKIIESYILGDSYGTGELINDYYDSILLELKHESTVNARLFAGAERSVEGDSLMVRFGDPFVAGARQKEIRTLLEQIFRERFHKPLNVRIEYKDGAGERLSDESERLLQEKINEIVEENETRREKKGEEDKTPKGGYQSPRKVRSKDPDLIYGRAFEGEDIPLSQVKGDMGEIVFHGKVIAVSKHEIANGRVILNFAVTDFTDSISVKLFLPADRVRQMTEEIKEGAFLRVKGIVKFDSYDGDPDIVSVTGIKRIPDFTDTRRDTAEKKRIELHCHTKMSEMDAVSDVADLVKRAHDWGHKAIAITDHGVVQAFQDANHFVEKLDADDPFKVIYGVEAYLVDDLTDIAPGAGNEKLSDTFTVFDIETTGLSPVKDRIIEIGAVKVKDGKIGETFASFVNPGMKLGFNTTKLTGITDDMLADAPSVGEILPEFLKFAKGSVLVAHNASFDVGFIKQKSSELGLSFDGVYADTVAMARVLMPNISKFKLDNVAKHLGVSLDRHHRAVDDAMAAAEIFVKFTRILADKGIFTLKDLNKMGHESKDAVKKMPTFHAVILAKNEIGRVNLYRLISLSHLTYYSRRPRIPKSELTRLREGLIVGSACEAGELYRAIEEGERDEVITRTAKFYDYLEIQPVANNAFLIDDEKCGSVTCVEDLKENNRRIVRLGEKLGIPVVATGDVHFTNPEDAIGRSIIMAGKGYSGAENQPPLYLHTTDEMLEEFSYLGEEKAYEVVVTSPNKVADMIEKISPVRPDRCPPVIPDSDTDLRRICYEKAHGMYGENLPEPVTKRLERELTSIISNGFAVMYISAQKLVSKSLKDGYLVGSRGSVGSSFVATMAGITEVNPLPPHYYCKRCHYSDFDSPEVKKYAGGCGWDMPDKTCPVCGGELTKDGFDIPFETFLGFKGNKEPDIDLNFSGDYQSVAHKYTEVIFGEGQTFRAGTISGLKDKIAYGYVKNYFQTRGETKRKCEIERLKKLCSGVKKSTGQHPGGIVVLPVGEDINTFTPLQHPANDQSTSVVTTHFDYHSIDHNLLKLDILGHDDPTMIKMLEEYITQLTGREFKATDIRMDDEKVMSLFAGTEALGIKPEDIGGCPVGCLGIPEFGTEFVIGMVVETKPKTFSDLIRISGLSHGEDVWLNNAQTVISEGKATIATAICTRDDIMTYLINKGMDSELSFNIMEAVRRGKVAKGECADWEEWKKQMLSHGVPEWYVSSCEKIGYMFPKAHAAAYVMMAFRIAYCKVYYPLAYYAAHFGIRAKAFSYEIMCFGREKLEYYMSVYEKKGDALSDKEQAALRDMKLVQEMYARGFAFLPIDLYKSRADRFLIEDGKLLPPFSAIDGLGEKAAEAIETEAKKGPFLSKEDFRQRTKVSKTVIEQLESLGVFGKLAETNQMTLF